MLKPYQSEFIDLVIKHNALSFGTFTLKSGRVSPYFFNLGKICDGVALQTLGRCMAAALIDTGWDFDSVCGPAYKGIPLAVTTTIAFAEKQRIVPYHFNRKEAKAHGEQSQWVGAPLQGNIVLVDDVMTAGTAMEDIIPKIRATSATLTGILIALDRQERGADTPFSAVSTLQTRYQLPIASIITLSDILDYVHGDPRYQPYAAAIATYRVQYGC